MTTAYYCVAAPITQLRTDEVGSHTHLTIWVNHGLSGILVVRNEELPDILHLLRTETEVLHTYFASGTHTSGDLPSLPSSLQLISEYGELTTLGNVRKSIGRYPD